MLSTLQEYCEGKEFDREVRKNIASRKPSSSHGSPLLDSIHSQLTPFAYKKFNLQYQQEAYDTVTSAEGGWYVQRYQTVGGTEGGDMAGGGKGGGEMAGVIYLNDISYRLSIYLYRLELRSILIIFLMHPNSTGTVIMHLLSDLHDQA